MNRCLLDRACRVARMSMFGAMIAGSGARAQVFVHAPGAMSQPALVVEDAPAFSVPGPRPTRGAVFEVDHAALVADLARAPVERVGEQLETYGMLVELPDPEGGMTACYVAASPVMAPELAARYPEIATYLVRSAGEGSLGVAVGRLEVSRRGLSGMMRVGSSMLRPSGATWMIDPWRSGDAGRVIAYRLGDLADAGEWTCHTAADGVPPAPGDGSDGGGGGFGERALQDLRQFRLAMACTGEYGAYHSMIQGHAPNAADPLAAIVTVVSRSNVVFENDMGVRFLLVANNDRVVFFDPVTDPFPTTCDGSGGADCSFEVYNVLGNVLRSFVGGGTYDTGHAVTRVPGGVASLPGACGGVGVSGIPRGGDIDPFAPNVVIHELGHQLGAAHTFSGARGRCGGNINGPTAWEAGSGSSPMAYAGGCPVGDAPPSDNIVLFADPFFHLGSIGQVNAFLSSPSSNCGARIATTNNKPVITSFTPGSPIPPGTPFKLTLAAEDIDGDVLTTSWEQFDSGVQRALSGDGSADNGAGALFRIFPPVAATSRTFPRMADVLSGVPTPGERLPTVTGVTRRFRGVVRDNRAGTGATATTPDINLLIPSGSTPFAVVAPAEGAVLRAGAATVSWTVGRTNLAPFNVASVVVRLSVDGGQTFPTVLGTFANTGSATVTMPAVNAASARVRIDPAAGIFFAISRPFVLEWCRADANGDGFLDFQDYTAFVEAFEGSGGVSADFNSDGFVDFFDYADYVAAFEAGC